MWVWFGMTSTISKTQMWEIEEDEKKTANENVSIFWHIVIRYYTAISIVMNEINVHNDIKYSNKNQAIQRWNWLINQYMVRLIGLPQRNLACVFGFFFASSFNWSHIIDGKFVFGYIYNGNEQIFFSSLLCCFAFFYDLNIQKIIVF